MFLHVPNNISKVLYSIVWQFRIGCKSHATLFTRPCHLSFVALYWPAVLWNPIQIFFFVTIAPSHRTHVEFERWINAIRISSSISVLQGRSLLFQSAAVSWAPTAARHTGQRSTALYVFYRQRNLYEPGARSTWMNPSVSLVLTSAHGGAWDTLVKSRPKMRFERQNAPIFDRAGWAGVFFQIIKIQIQIFWRFAKLRNS